MKKFAPLKILLTASLTVSFLILLLSIGGTYKNSAKNSKNVKSKYKVKSTDELLRELTKRKCRKGKFGFRTTEQLLKGLIKRKWFRYKSGYVYSKEEVISVIDETDLSSLKRSISEEISTIFVLLGEIPEADRRAGVFAPVFLTDQKNIFGSRTDLSFRWVGYKLTARFTQKRFPLKNTSLQETLIGSFVYASGTNFGFIGGRFQEETRFYTNYISEIITLKCQLPAYFFTAINLDSRQYFFVKRSTPEGFVMPLNHYNVFPRFDLGFKNLKEKGIDLLTYGFELSSWIGYGIRNRWEQWGMAPDYQTGEEARKFLIYSASITGGLLLGKHHNIVLRARYKGGRDNDFLNRPRFGGTIDNANLDVVHGFTIDSFRVNSYGLINFKYGFNLFSRLRLSFYFDYAHIFSTESENSVEDVLGSGYGFRIISFGGLPIWFTHGLGREYYPYKKPVEQVFMIMTAAGW